MVKKMKAEKEPGTLVMNERSIQSKGTGNPLVQEGENPEWISWLRAV